MATASPPTATPEAPSPAPAGAVRPRRNPPVERPPSRQYVRHFLHSLVDPETYDVRANPSLLLGFLMAVPIPVLTAAAHSPVWLVVASLFAPPFWAVVLGAAGRVGIRAEQAQAELEAKIAETRHQAMAVKMVYEEALDEEVAKREDLERREQAVVNELQLAADVHRTLLPPNIQRPDVEVAIRQIPTQFVGGDYLHASVIQDRYLYLIVGDVSGHGVAAALVVARVHGLIRRLTFARRSRPATVLDRVNRAAIQLFKHTYFFMTMGVFRLDLQTGKLRYATAGHPAQALLRKDGTVERLRTRNRLLGIDADIFDSETPSAVVHMEPGDSLVLFTDGLFEILSRTDREVLDEDEFYQRIATMKGLTPALMAGEILQELADFQGSSAFADDVSLLVATYRGRQEPPELGTLR